MSFFPTDIITYCNEGETYKYCCVTLNDANKCCYAGTCETVS